GAKEVHGEAEYTLVIRTNQLLESILVTALHRPNYGGFIHLPNSPGGCHPGRILKHNPRVYREPLPPKQDRRAKVKSVTELKHHCNRVECADRLTSHNL